MGLTEDVKNSKKSEWHKSSGILFICSCVCSTAMIDIKALAKCSQSLLDERMCKSKKSVPEWVNALLDTANYRANN